MLNRIKEKISATLLAGPIFSEIDSWNRYTELSTTAVIAAAAIFIALLAAHFMAVVK
jgi:hypothetical protein